jgi:hypothetical protein
MSTACGRHCNAHSTFTQSKHNRPDDNRHRHRRPTSLTCTFTCFAHIPSSVFCFLKHVDGRASTCYATMEREREREGEATMKHSHAQATTACYFFSRRELQIKSTDGVSWIAQMQWQVLFTSGDFMGCLGFMSRKKGSRTEGFDARHGPGAKQGRNCRELGGSRIPAPSSLLSSSRERPT